jgi:HK97 family phage major capsid protein
MMKTSDLIEQRAAIVARMNSAHDADDSPAFTTAETELRALDTKIERAKAIDDAERRQAGTPLKGQGDEHLSRELRSSFSMVRAMAMQAGLAGHDYGFEREVQPELAKRAGKAPEGILVPMEVFLEKRTLTTTAPSGAVGGNLIATELHGEMFFDRLRAALKVQSMGATVLSNLVGNVDIPGLKDSVTAGWVAENSALTPSDAGFRKVSMTPKHAAGITEISRNMLQQTSVDVENLIRNDFAFVLAAIVDLAAIAGTGASNQPTGILNTSGIGSLAMGTNGAAWTADAARDLIGKVDIPDAPNTSRGFLTNNKVKVAASKLKDGQGNYMTAPGVWAGERVEFSSNVPSNLTKGSGTNLSAVIYGNWADLIIGYWSAFDLLVNPYESTAYAKGNVSVRAMLTCDIAIRYAESFAAAKDVLA